MHPDLVTDFLAIKANELLYLGIDAIISMNAEADADSVLRGKVLYVQSLLDGALRSPPSLAELADAVGLSHSALSSEFRRHTGLTLAQYVAESRMKNAHLLLESTRMPLKQIAYELGYNHASNLCLAFKRHFGKTPGDARSAAGRSHPAKAIPSIPNRS
jgi:transcriptional regulator GlxA family with amidase domain